MLIIFTVPMEPSSAGVDVAAEEAGVDRWPRTSMFLSLQRCRSLRILACPCADPDREVALRAERELPRRLPRATREPRSAVALPRLQPTRAAVGVLEEDRAVEEATPALVGASRQRRRVHP